jgi:hypothetical protein
MSALPAFQAITINKLARTGAFPYARLVFVKRFFDSAAIGDE